MSIPIPRNKVSPFGLDERQWLRRLRGSSLGQLADMANQLAFRKGLNCISKSWSYSFDRSDKSGEGGYPFFSSDLFTSQNVDFYVDIPFTHPGASQIGVILTYLAPNDLENDLNPASGLGGAGQSDIRLRLTNYQGTTTIDPPSSSGETWAVIMSGSEMPSPRVVFGNDNSYESVTAGAMILSQGDGEYGYSARMLRTVLHLDRGTLGGYTAPRRLGYDTQAGSSGTLTVNIRASYAAILDAFVFEIPKLVV